MSGTGIGRRGIGHNLGPTLEPGASWRRHCWQAARAALLPKLPVEVVRVRVKRAAEIGLDYRTYAGVRATTGHDIVAFLFSTNALRLLREGQALEAARAAKLAAIGGAGRMVAVNPPLDPARVGALLAAQAVAVEALAQAPAAHAPWAAQRRVILALLAGARRPADQVLLVGDTGAERDWAAAARLAGYLPAERYFAPPCA